MVKLNDSELDAILHAAGLVRAEDRDAFLQGVTSVLQQYDEAGPGAVFQVCNELQRQFISPPVDPASPSPGLS